MNHIVKRLLDSILSAIIYIVSWHILAAIAIFSNYSITGRWVGAVSGVGGLTALWVAYRITKWIRTIFLKRIFKK